MKRFFVFFTCLALCISCSKSLTNEPATHGMDFEKCFKSDLELCLDCEDLALVWDFPVKTGTDEWAKFKTNEEMVEACQIPENILASLTTEELTAICLNYPLIYDVFAFNQMKLGIDKLFADFNGIRELFGRDDVSDELLKHYHKAFKNISFLDGDASELAKGYFVVSFSIFEFLLSRYYSHDGAIENYTKILQSLAAVYYEKTKYPEYMNYLGFETNFFARAHIIKKICEECLLDDRYFGTRFSKDDMALINELSCTLISNHKI